MEEKIEKQFLITIFLVLFVLFVFSNGPLLEVIYYPLYMKAIFFLLTPFCCLSNLFFDSPFFDGFSLIALLILWILLIATLIFSLIYLWYFSGIIYHFYGKIFKNK